MLEDLGEASSVSVDSFPQPPLKPRASGWKKKKALYNKKVETDSISFFMNIKFLVIYIQSFELFYSRKHFTNKTQVRQLSGQAEFAGHEGIFHEMQRPKYLLGHPDRRQKPLHVSWQTIIWYKIARFTADQTLLATIYIYIPSRRALMTQKRARLRSSRPAPTGKRSKQERRAGLLLAAWRNVAKANWMAKA